jgi:hypothetical protein
VRWFEKAAYLGVLAICARQVDAGGGDEAELEQLSDGATANGLRVQGSAKKCDRRKLRNKIEKIKDGSRTHGGGRQGCFAGGIARMRKILS